MISSSHRRSSTGDVPLSAWSHVVCVSYPFYKSSVDQLCDVYVRSLAPRGRRREKLHHRAGAEQGHHGGRKKSGDKDFLTGGDNIELALEGGECIFQGLDSLDGYGFYVPDCRGGCEDLVTYERNVDACSN